jgi:hypothetical protein
MVAPGGESAGTPTRGSDLEPRIVPKLHSFFSQGRGITTCLRRPAPQRPRRAGMPHLRGAVGSRAPDVSAAFLPRVRAGILRRGYRA